MADYVQEFREFINFTKCKTLSNGFIRSNSRNLIKLGIFFNSIELTHPQFKKWMRIFHKSCKRCKTVNFSNTYLLSFQMKLAKISKRLMSEIIMKDSNKLLIDIFNQSDKDLNCGKLRKLMFVKKFTRLLPIEIKRLIADISFYIGESVNEKEIDAVFMESYDEVINVKRKKFARQIKESLIKYYNDFGGFCKLENEIDKKENFEDELNECLRNFDSNVYVCKPATDFEIINKSQDNDNIPFHFEDNTLKNSVAEPGKSLLIVEGEDFDDFNVIDEWNESGDNEISSNDVEINFTDQLMSSLTEINNNILEKFIGNEKLFYSVNNLLEINCHLNSCPGNRTISNLQESFLLNFVNDLDEMILKIKCNDKEIETKNEISEELLCNHKSYSKPKPLIKIMTLKKPYAYLSIDNAPDNVSNEINLENIPLPNKNQSKINNGENVFNRNTLNNIVHANKEANIEDIRSDTFEDDMIPESILDFSDILNDEFDGKENADLHLNTKEFPVSVINDNCKGKLSENRLIILKNPNTIENLCEIDNDETQRKQNINGNINGNYQEIDYNNVESECNYKENVFDRKYDTPDNVVCQSNCSIFTIDRNYNHNDFHPHYPNGQYDEFPYDNEDFDSHYFMSRSKPNHYHYRNNTMNNNNNNNNYRNYDRGNRRLFRNFLRYTCQSNNSDRRWLNESQRF